MKHLLRRLLLALAIGAIALPALAQPAPQPPKDAGPPGVIRGRITAGDTGKPLRRVRIQVRAVSAPTARPISMASTNAQGVFELKEVPPGAYYVSATRVGYVELQHGQRRPRERGLAIEVKSGQTVEKIDIALPRAGVMAGRISDELGEPYPGVSVRAWEVRYMNGRAVAFPIGNAVTDDLGQYRITDLLPGSYRVSATSSENWRNEKNETLGYATTFYPGVMSDAAQTISLGVSQQRLDLDFSIAASRTMRIRGRVQRPTGEPLPGESVTLAVSIPGVGAIATAGARPVRTESDGSFEIRDIAPGDYALLTRAGGGYANLLLPIVADMDNLLLVPRTGSTVSGSIVAENGAAPPFPASGVRLYLIAPGVDDVLPTVRLPAVNNDWSFSLSNVGGPFLFRVQGLPADWMLDAVRLNDADLTDTPWNVPSGGQNISGLQLVITRKVGNISGNVTDADGKPTPDATVVIFSEDSAFWMTGSRFIRSARPNSDGAFSITGLPAGTYRAVAKDYIIDGQWENREFLESVRNEGVRVTLTEGGAETVALKVAAP